MLRIEITRQGPVRYESADGGRTFAGPPREIYLTDLDPDVEPEMQIAFPLGP